MIPKALGNDLLYYTKINLSIPKARKVIPCLGYETANDLPNFPEELQALESAVKELRAVRPAHRDFRRTAHVTS